MNVCFIFFVSLVTVSNGAIYQLSDDEYELMPPIVELDPYDRCLRSPGGAYCTAYVAFLSDGASPLLYMMQEYSKHAVSHYNHTRALFGTCLSTEYEHGNTTDDLGQLLEARLNRTLWEKYQLKAKVEDIISCKEHGQKPMKVGTADIAVAGVVLALVVCNVVGSLVDVYCFEQNNGLVVQFLVCFSLPRNWRRLFAPSSGSEPRLGSFEGIHGIRVILMIGVLVAHSALPCVLLCENPKFIEDEYTSYPFHIVLNGTVIMQTFLFFSAFLLVYNFLLHSKRHLVTWRMLPIGIAKRWLRLTPPYALVLALTATWLRHVGTGPIWDYAVVRESRDCSLNWWHHLLYFNNYVDDSLCMPQAWYLATDTQLYVVGLLVLVWGRSARARHAALAALFLVGLLAPALHTYFQDLDGTLLISPSATMSFFTSDRTFNKVYKRGHTNLSSYVLGMASGFLLYHLQNNKFDIDRYKKWRVVYWLLFPVGLGIVVSFKTFYGEGPRPDPLLRALISALIKPFYGLIAAIFTLGMVFKIENMYRDILEWGGWRSAARVSYSAYLLHVAVIRAGVGGLRGGVHVSYLRLAETILFTVVVTYAAAYLFWLTVEAPLAQAARGLAPCRPLTNEPRQEDNTVKTDTKTKT